MPTREIRRNDGEIHESIDLLRFLTGDLQLISRRKPILKVFQFGFNRSKDFRREDSGAGKHNIEIVRKCSRRRKRLVSRMFLAAEN